ncbi:hypothetical protein PV08_11103 [Exophiala spinifera]|uniref:Uncharacterized protein n=1 Tax=Exophiala spinifera TaxID=91928 RepID=A0A0D1ZAV2_9EURO|nr:uncharacterized protein PV08_11103 [Exophiala spinifera]KIW10142.1 hypothetical protein PV08_11103 [Exophiala spinifera]
MSQHYHSVSSQVFDDNSNSESLPLRPIHRREASDAEYLSLDGQRVSESLNSPRDAHSRHETRLHRVARGEPQYLSLQNAEFVDEPSPHSPELPPGTKTPATRPSWKPYPLQWPFLLTTLSIALLLGLVVIFLLAYSATHHGLGRDDGSSSVLFGWRFTPTLITVLYSILTAMIYSDTLRTESFSQMSHQSGADSASSILRSKEQWWTVLWSSLRRRHNHGQLNFYLLAVTLADIIGFLLINPLSSALLQSQSIDLESQISFSRYRVDETEPLRMESDDLVYFRTVGNILQNLTTSAWLTEKYAVVPFWRPPGPSMSDTTLTGLNQQWQVNSSVFSVTLECEAMSTNTTEANDGALILSDRTGCETAIGVCGESINSLGGGSWFTPPDFVTPIWWEDDYPKSCYNSTAECADRQVILITNSTWEFNTSYTTSKWFRASAWSCGTTFYRADIPVSISTGPAGSVLGVDDATFIAHRRLVEPTVLNTTRFDNAFLNRNWTSMIYPSYPSSTPQWGGVSVLLAALYDFAPLSMFGKESVVNRAQKIKQRFLGEMMLNTVARNSPTQQAGTVTVTERRVLVNLPIAISLAVLFILSAALIAFALWESGRRHLNLFHDPASIAALIQLTEDDKPLRDYLKAKQPGSSRQDDANLRSMRHFLQDGAMSTVLNNVNNEENVVTKSPVKRDENLPFPLRLYAGLLLLLFLALVFAAILTLFTLAQTVGLYESAFTYETDLVPSDSSLFTFAPYSIVPTLLAVIIGLWWDGLDDTFRRLQPFVTMSRKALPVSPIIGLSYMPTYSVVSVIKALRNRHEYVALVSTAAILVQVLTVSMSALWQRADGSRPGDLTLARDFEPRTQPFVYTFAGTTAMGAGDINGQEIISSFYGNLSTNWLYSAALQLAYNGSEPPWSSDGWSFVPVNLSSISDSSVYKTTPSANDRDDTSAAASTTTKAVNVTVTTPALRGVLDCSTVTQSSNLSGWTTQWDLTDGMIWNVSRNPTVLQRGYEVNSGFNLAPKIDDSTTPILSQYRTLLCCRNLSSPDGDSGASALGYWSNNYEGTLAYDFDSSYVTYPRNFTMKWIRGTTARNWYLMNETYSGYYTGEYDDFRHLIWTREPQISALNCRPRVEWSNASVTVDRGTGRVYKYKIVDAVQDLPQAFSDAYLEHDYVAPGDNATDGVFHNQYTVSFGVLFQDAMLFASDLQKFWPSGGSSESSVEDLDDKNFNIRIEGKGLNADLMSFAMYQLASGNVDALMDLGRMEQLGQKVFTTFFQHFVSANVSAEGGGWGFQKIGATLPAILAPLANGTQPDTNSSLTAAADTQVRVHVEIAVEVLQMSPVAVYLSLSILFVLIVVTLFVYTFGYALFRNLRSRFENLAGVVSVVADSERLRRWVRDHPNPETWGRERTRSGHEAPLVKLGTFVGSDGNERWGIEIVTDGEEKNWPVTSDAESVANGGWRGVSSGGRP